VAGILFAIPYVFIMRTVDLGSPFATVAVGAAVGLFHGAGPEVAAAHIVGHVAYGIGVGLVAGLMGEPNATTALDLIRRAVGLG
jgi:hypothetical protein